MAGQLFRESTKNMSHEQWLSYRSCGLGGSDISALLGISSYKSPLELYLEKIGEHTPFQSDNRFTFFGNLHEDEIASLYQYWDGDMDSMIANRKDAKKVNRVRSVNAFIHNPRYPQLFASIDRMILSNPKRQARKGILECKNTSSFVLRRYDGQIPYEYVVQVIGYLLVTGWDHASLAIEVDGNDYKVFPYERTDSSTKDIMAEIERASAPFWSKVLRARIIKEEFGITSYYSLHPDTLKDPKIQEGVAMLQELEPDIVNDSTTESFLSKIFKPEPLTIEGTQEIWKLAVDYLQSKENEGLAKKDKVHYSNLIKAEMKNTERVDFEEAGSITWKADSKGVRRFSVNIKN